MMMSAFRFVPRYLPVTKTFRTAALLTLLLGGSAVQALPGQTDPAPFRDLNHNGRLDPYEDARLSAAHRSEDLLRRMTLAEKVGTMLHGSLANASEPARGYDLAGAEKMIFGAHVTSLITRLSISPRLLAEQNNAVQRLAERTRLGIPVTISTDPRNHFQAVLGASTAGGGFSLWPETLGMAALRDPALVRRFGDMARAEYRAVGIHMALSPQADLATEPRWPRVTATFGSDPALVSAMAGAYVQGFQGGTGGVRVDGVATVVKHWVGYGAEPEGFDGHNYYGRAAKLTDRSFAQHVAAFDGALRARAAGVMPTYPILTGVTVHGQPLEPVGAGFNKVLLTGLLRGEKRFEGLVLSDWAITNDCPERCRRPTIDAPQRPSEIGMPWGVEMLTQQQRFAKGVNAGVDQFGGVADPAPLLAAVKDGQVSTAQVDDAVRRVLLLKFRLGLFDQPYVDPDAAARVVGSPESQALADRAQREAQVLLENRHRVLPVRAAGTKVWLYRVDPMAATRLGLRVVATPAEADVAILRVDAPSERLHPNHFFGSRQNEGRLEFRDGDPDWEAIKRASAIKPVVVAVNLDRPAVLSEVRRRARGLIATFGASDAAVLDVVTGRARAKGKLPFELPSSMATVARQEPARPDDSERPLYRFGFGLD